MRLRSLLLLGASAGVWQPAPARRALRRPALPWPYEPFPEAVDPFSNISTPEKVELGRQLFYDPS